MTVSPQNFFIGLIDFFSVILPGALFVIVLMGLVTPTELVDGTPLDGVTGWLAFLFASYLLGHVVFAVGSLLDDWIYDPLRRCAYGGLLDRLADGRDLPAWPVRALARTIFGREDNAAVTRAGAIRRAALGPLSAEGAINTYQWSKALLDQENPTGLAVVQRFEADSKFFRSMVVILVVALCTSPWQDWPWGLTVALAALVPVAAWRYMEQRWKATNQAYRSVLTLVSTHPDLLPAPGRSSIGGPGRAGGVVYRTWSGQIEYLLVEARRRPGTWVLPKGHVETDETWARAAVREVCEEAGVLARVVGTRRAGGAISDSEFVVDGEDVAVRYYLMEKAGWGPRSDRGRGVMWLRYDQAWEQLHDADAREVLARADRERRGPVA
jgi:ADP-ribose pyrophosphatase YjhB (NUDIX family)